MVITYIDYCLKVFSPKPLSMTFINNIGTAVPIYKHAQADILDFMLKSTDYSAEEIRKISLMYHRSGIKSRHSVLPDYGAQITEREFYPHTADLEPFPIVDQRMDAYDANAAILAQEAILNTIDASVLAEITHLITVSCTGMSAPGLDIELVEKLNLQKNIVRTSVNFMGCYAAIHGLKLADAFCHTNPSAKVLVVCVELCTLHFQKEKSLDYQTSNLLFADGAAACLVSNEAVGFGITGFYSELALQGKPDMAWRISKHGFLMTLSNHIPKLLEGGMKAMLESAMANHDVAYDSIKHWAVHPGGKSILESIQKAVGISRSDCWASYDVLSEFGNMSSATILFVLKKLQANIQPNEHTFAVAFGPGLTMESMILKGT